MPDIFSEQIPCPVNFKTLSGKLKTPSSVPYEEECSTVRSSPDGTEINKYQEKMKNLTIKLTALQLFIKVQVSIIKKQLEGMVNTQELTNRKSISSLQEEIDYLREENQAKTQIIKHFTDMKVVPSNNDITTGVCSCKLASTHTYCVDSNYKKPSIDLETNTKSNKSLDKIRNQQNKNTTEKLDSDQINKKNKKQGYRSESYTKKKEKKDEENKRYEYGKKTRNIENDVPRKNRKLYIF